jgi:hypothetical protein
MRLGGRADLREPFSGKPNALALWGNGVKKLRDFSRNAMTHLKKEARSDEH